MKMSENGRNSLTIPSEGLRLKAYDDAQPNKILKIPSDVIGNLTIGYGHTGTDVFIGQIINEAKAISLLIVDMGSAENTVTSLVKVPVTQNMFDSLVDFVFNAGSGNFKNSTLLKKLNNSEYTSCGDEFLRWNKSQGQIMAGLTIRCKARRELFLTGIGSLTYYSFNGDSFTPQSSNGLVKLIAGLSILGSIT